MWLHPKQGTDAALALALGHVVLREFYVDRQTEYFADYTRKYSDFPLLVMLVERDGRLVADRLLRAADIKGQLGEKANPDWKAVAYDERSGKLVSPLGSAGHRWGDPGKWNLEEKDGKGREVRLRTTLADDHDSIEPVAFPYFGGDAPHDFVATAHDDVLLRNVPVKQIKLANGDKGLVATVFDLFCANYGVDRGFGGGNVGSSFDDDVPFTPAWAEKVTVVSYSKVEKEAVLKKNLGSQALKQLEAELMSGPAPKVLSQLGSTVSESLRAQGTIVGAVGGSYQTYAVSAVYLPKSGAARAVVGEVSRDMKDLPAVADKMARALLAASKDTTAPADGKTDVRLLAEKPPLRPLDFNKYGMGIAPGSLPVELIPREILAGPNPLGPIPGGPPVAQGPQVPWWVWTGGSVLVASAAGGAAYWFLLKPPPTVQFDLQRNSGH
jgi:hypothetical protein